ncbi:hypothetical protein IV500_12130 [Paeniglutamicibacter antarcticus]|uniref:Uncharacterized protein n=1 Tax=Arthrobacter terrae TaxID=2935737 RepID=A0A931G5N1_9MICC|nr:hypothetical protein [Arthrobacter terrae]MBG0740128.1 hypothetical protein [Arthrobacter terrae]
MTHRNRSIPRAGRKSSMRQSTDCELISPVEEPLPVLTRQQNDMLKEFLDLVAVLNYKAVRLGSFYSALPEGSPAEAENDRALSYIQTSLEDVMATAVGIAKSFGPEQQARAAA